MSKNDAVVKQLLTKVDEQKNGLGNKPRGTWVTNGVFKRDSSNVFNINTVTDFTRLAEALGFLMSQAEFYQKACKELSIPVTPFKWDGYTIAEWKEDFQMRKDIVEWNDRKKSLDATTAKLKGLMSLDARTEEDLESIKASLGL